MLKKIIFTALLSAGLLCGTEYAVIVPQDAIPAEKTAGRELQTFLSRLTGKKVAMGTQKQFSGSRYKFYTGRSPEIKKALGLRDFNSFKPDEILLKRVGDNFYFTGDRPRGTLYAVHTFLEDFCGMRFYAPDETVYPEKFVLPGKVDLRYAPCFIIRETPFVNLRLKSDFSARRKVNGHWQKTSEDWGGHEKIWQFCHTFRLLLPPEKYGKSHPEYYSEINGVRRPVGNQLCLSNENMRQELIKNIRNILRADKSIRIISVSQDDNSGYCRCKNCTLLAGRFGNARSGLLVDCLNKIGEALEKEFPDVLFETLAYEYSVRAPQNIKPRKNVIIRLCANNCDYGQPLYAPVNAPFGTALKSWAKLTDRLMVWNYVSLFYNHMIPNPNWGLHGKNLRFFRDNGVIAVFNQAGGGDTGDFSHLRAYVNSKLLWDPDLDEDQLIREFVRNYYGKEASPLIMKYLSMLKIDYKKQKPGFKLKWDTSAFEWLSLEKTEEARALLEKAVAVSKGKYRQRVDLVKNAIDFAFLLHPETFKKYRKMPEIPRQVLADFCRRTRGNKNYGEGKDLASLKKSLNVLYGIKTATAADSLPPEFGNVPSEDIVTVPAADMTAYENKIRTERIQDFIRMRADHKGWLIQFPGLDMRTRNEGVWKIYAQMRTGGQASDKGFAFQSGVYYQQSKETVARRYPFKAAAGKEFKTVPLGKYISGKGNAYFFLAPVGNDAAGPIDFKTLYLVRVRQ